MPLFTIQQRPGPKRSTKTTTKRTKSRVTALTSSMSHCIRNLSSVKKVFGCRGSKRSVHSISPSPYSFSGYSCISEVPCGSQAASSRRLSDKSMALDSLIFDHPSVTLCLRPAAYRS
ncbi:hypothetical protein CLU79DRAFT_836907 [Phycomyces nitens]|nr:hypothetical protein CLU79DRAFT_836907 [Phycomyces nitens]